MKAQLQRLKRVLIEIADVPQDTDYEISCGTMETLARKALESKHVEQPHTNDCLCDECLPIDVNKEKEKKACGCDNPECPDER